MNLDLRIPMGLMFTLVGMILSVYGLMTMGSPMYAMSGGLNANLDWGLVLLVFGAVMFTMGRNGQRRADKTPAKPSDPSAPVRRGH